MVPESAILICCVPLMVYLVLVVYIKRRERGLARRRHRQPRGAWRPYVGKSKYVLQFFSVLDYRSTHNSSGDRDNILWWWWQGMIRHHDMLAPFLAPDDDNGKGRDYHAAMMIAKYAATVGVCTMLFHLVRRKEIGGTRMVGANVLRLGDCV